jgi:hypothetical protein
MRSQDLEEYAIEPFKKVGSLTFGMSRSDAHGILGDFQREIRTFTGGIAEVRENIFCIYKKDKLSELTFSIGAKLTLDGRLLLKQDGIDFLLSNYTHKKNDVGFTIFPSLGVAFTGFGKSKDNKVVMVFDKTVLKQYLAQVS